MMKTGEKVQKTVRTPFLAHLDAFWNAFGGCPEAAQPVPRNLKIQFLRRFVAIKLDPPKSLTKKDRAIRNAIEESQAAKPIHAKCFCCARSGTHRHNIIQVKSGGIPSKRNQVYLCDLCTGELGHCPDHSPETTRLVDAFYSDPAHR